ncbi:cyclic nucleotide-binding domain-containing protein [Treponema primitia]|uniref:cyclic nucleotide-binding domain-containing protein n=1 Tax=Treponema primitia TaxID=88058 RepID=UPI0002554C5F|nr:cyclic nucleotide-binding domain-containing protein [Treponema primitia]
MVSPSSLQKYSLFGGLLEDQIDQIMPLMEQEDYAPGDAIIVEGEPNDKIRFILEGRVAAEKTGIVLFEFKEGDAFGEMEVLDVMPSAATIKALTPTRVMSISNRALRSIYKLDIKAFSLMLMNLARDLSRRLRYVDDGIASGKYKSSK